VARGLADPLADDDGPEERHGAPEQPAWYLNLEANPEVGVQVKADKFRARARTAEGEERERLWKAMNEIWPHYDEYQTKTTRQIPVVVLDRI
jgi:proline iminopeptidase